MKANVVRYKSICFEWKYVILCPRKFDNVLNKKGRAQNN